MKFNYKLLKRSGKWVKLIGLLDSLYLSLNINGFCSGRDTWRINFLFNLLSAIKRTINQVSSEIL